VLVAVAVLVHLEPVVLVVVLLVLQVFLVMELLVQAVRQAKAVHQVPREKAEPRD
jgi:hypothetical protein